jgi:hypothetical protein
LNLLNSQVYELVYLNIIYQQLKDEPYLR